jgi:hypothetical protein
VDLELPVAILGKHPIDPRNEEVGMSALRAFGPVGYPPSDRQA